MFNLNISPENWLDPTQLIVSLLLLDCHCCNIKRPDLRRRAGNPVGCSHIGRLLLSSKNEAGGESASQRYHQKCNTSIDQ